MKKWMPWILVAVFAAWFLGGFEAPKPKNGFDIAAFGRLPVLMDGRVQPLDSVARNALLSISGRSIVRVSNAPPLSATEWLLDTMTQPQLADSLKFFRVQHPDLEGSFGTQNAGLEYYSFNDMSNQLEHLQDQAQAVMNSEKDKDDAVKSRTPYQRDLLHLVNSLVLYNHLKNSLEPEGTRDFTQELKAYQVFIVPGKLALEQSKEGKEANSQDLNRIAAAFDRYSELAKLAGPLIIPPASGQPRTAWANIGNSLLESLHSEEISPAATSYAAMATAAKGNQPEEFNRAVSGYRVWLNVNDLYPALKKGGQEFFFNQIEPFYNSHGHLCRGRAAGLPVLDQFVGNGAALRVRLLVLAFVIHTIGLVFRM